MIQRVYTYDVSCDCKTTPNSTGCSTIHRYDTYNKHANLFTLLEDNKSIGDAFIVVRDYTTYKAMSYCQQCFYEKFEYNAMIYFDRHDLTNLNLTPVRIKVDKPNGKSEYKHWWHYKCGVIQSGIYDIFFDFNNAVMLCVLNKTFSLSYVIKNIKSYGDLKCALHYLDNEIEKINFDDCLIYKD